nr:MAG TPA: hypothetical protein [Caudoviricetes sp.]
MIYNLLLLFDRITPQICEDKRVLTRSERTF